MASNSSNNSIRDFLGNVFTESGTPVRVIWQAVQGILVFASCLSMLLENFEAYQVNYAGFITALDFVAIGFLTVDYFGNLYFAEDRMRYMFSFWGLVDLLSIAPFYLMMFNPTSGVLMKCLRAMRFVRALVLLRIIRVRF